MIDFDKIEKKLKPLNDKIYDINLKFGKEISDDLLNRIEVALSAFFEDFKQISGKSFDCYWEKQKRLKDEGFSKISSEKSNTENINSEELLDTPKFISEYEKKNN